MSACPGAHAPPRHMLWSTHLGARAPHGPISAHVVPWSARALECTQHPGKCTQVRACPRARIGARTAPRRARPGACTSHVRVPRQARLPSAHAQECGAHIPGVRSHAGTWNQFRQNAHCNILLKFWRTCYSCPLPRNLEFVISTKLRIQ